LSARGHTVAVETGAGQGAGIGDEEYLAAGAQIVPSADNIFQRAELIVKVKEPFASERKRLRRGQIIFTYLHLAPDREQTRDLMVSGATAIGYETVTDAAGKLPLLAPMSKVAGRMAPQVAAHFLERPHGGRGVLLGGIDGVSPAKVVVLGAGTVGHSAIEVATGMGAEVTAVVRRAVATHALPQMSGGSIRAVAGGQETVEALCVSADVVIGAALVAGAAAPKLISAATVAAMKPGADCVANMPGAVPRTSTFALNNATRPFILALADKGFPRALVDDVHLRNGLNVHDGKVTLRAVADALGLPYTPAADVLAVS
jgi:alanine dehydrogenase